MNDRTWAINNKDRCTCCSWTTEDLTLVAAARLPTVVWQLLVRLLWKWRVNCTVLVVHWTTKVMMNRLDDHRKRADYWALSVIKWSMFIMRRNETRWRSAKFYLSANKHQKRALSAWNYIPPKKLFERTVKRFALYAGAPYIPCCELY